MGCIIKGYKAHMCCQGGGIRHLRNMRTMFTNRLHFLAIYSLFAAFTSTWGINQINIHIKMIELHSWTKKQSGLAGGCTCGNPGWRKTVQQETLPDFPNASFFVITCT